MGPTTVNPTHAQLGLPQAVPLLDVAASLVQIVGRQIQRCVVHVRVVVLCTEGRNYGHYWQSVMCAGSSYYSQQLYSADVLRCAL